MLANNPAYQLQHEANGLKVYIPTNIMEGYHTSRYIEANNQIIYADAGATAQTLEYAMDEIIKRANDRQWESARTDIAGIAQSIKYRLKYPVDNLCAIRMGAILCFAEENGVEEDPDTCLSFWLEKKMTYAMKYPEWYSFFLTWGVSNLEQYRNRLDTLSGLDYFQKRKEAIMSTWGDLEQFKI